MTDGAKTRKMKGFLVIFLCMYAYCADAATFGAVGAPICGYGMYKYAGECVPLSQQADKCAQINGVGTYRVPLDVSSFLYQEVYGTQACQGTHVLYEYDDAIFVTLGSAGSLRTFGAPMCGYGQYRLNGTCYDYADANAVGSCPQDFYKSVSDTASFMDLYSQGIVCNGTYDLYEYSELLHPLFNGILLPVGAALQTAADMQQTRCTVNPDEYYQIAVATADGFAFPDAGVCATGAVKYGVKSDCKDIDVTDANVLRANSVCGVLCSGNQVYTNSGSCATGYCNLGGVRRRLNFRRDGVTHSISMYASPVTTPSINIGGGGLDGVCYINLVTQPHDNTIRVKYNDTVYYAVD